MKITKFKSGWRINITDTEMDILLKQLKTDRWSSDYKNDRWTGIKTDRWSGMKTAFAQVPSIRRYCRDCNGMIKRYELER